MIQICIYDCKYVSIGASGEVQPSKHPPADLNPRMAEAADIRLVRPI